MCRVCVSPEPFLLVVYSPLRSRPEFYQMETQDSRPDLQIELHSAFKTIRLPNVSPAVRASSVHASQVVSNQCVR